MEARPESSLDSRSTSSTVDARSSGGLIITDTTEEKTAQELRDRNGNYVEPSYEAAAPKLPSGIVSNTGGTREPGRVRTGGMQTTMPQASGPGFANAAPEAGDTGAMGSAPEASDPGVMGLAPEAGELDLDYGSPEAGEAASIGLAPEASASDPGTPGPAPEASGTGIQGPGPGETDLGMPTTPPESQ